MSPDSYQNIIFICPFIPLKSGHVCQRCFFHDPTLKNTKPLTKKSLEHGLNHFEPSKLEIFPKVLESETNKKVWNQDLVCEYLWHSTTSWHGVMFSTETNLSSTCSTSLLEGDRNLLSLRHFCVDTQHVDRQAWRHHRIETSANTIGVNCTLEARTTMTHFKRKPSSHKASGSFNMFQTIPLKKNQAENLPNKGKNKQTFVWPQHKHKEVRPQRGYLPPFSLNKASIKTSSEKKITPDSLMLFTTSEIRNVQKKTVPSENPSLTNQDFSRWKLQPRCEVHQLVGLDANIIGKMISS